MIYKLISFCFSQLLIWGMINCPFLWRTQKFEKNTWFLWLQPTDDGCNRDEVNGLHASRALHHHFLVVVPVLHFDRKNHPYFTPKSICLNSFHTTLLPNRTWSYPRADEYLALWIYHAHTHTQLSNCDQMIFGKTNWNLSFNFNFTANVAHKWTDRFPFQMKHWTEEYL